MRSQTFAAHVSKSGFIRWGHRLPLGATELFSGGHVQRASRDYEQRQRPKLSIVSDEQGATSVESLLKEATAHESLRTTVLY